MWYYLMNEGPRIEEKERMYQSQHRSYALIFHGRSLRCLYLPSLFLVAFLLESVKGKATPARADLSETIGKRKAAA